MGDGLRQHRGRGISLGLKSSSTASPSVAIVRMHFDGSVIGALAARPTWDRVRARCSMQIAAQELGISPTRIALVMGDTSVVPFDSSTSASRSTVFMGNAIIDACASIKSQVEAIVAATPGALKDMTLGDLLKAHFGPIRGELWASAKRAMRTSRAIRWVDAQPSGNSCVRHVKWKSIPKPAK